MNKKEILFNLINEKKATSCTILGVPTMELLENVIKGQDIMKLFSEKGIKIPHTLNSDGLEHAFINVYISHINSKLCAITISKEAHITTELVKKIINTFFVEIVDLYQFDILPYHIDIIVSNDTISIEDILLYISSQTSQNELAEKLGISKQLITELKKRRVNMSINTLAAFIKEYPLMPWYEYLLSK